MEAVFDQKMTEGIKGAYAVNMFTLGVPSTVVVDDYVPFVKDRKKLLSA